jgi:calcineurin-like phosphoesterase family protein
MSVFITSDTHFSHKNIIEYCQRPFETYEQMDEALVENWNSVVTDEDVVIHLGDVFWNHGRAHAIAPRLRGVKHLIRGNHDWNVERMTALGFRCLTHLKNDIHYEYYDKVRIIMCHRPRDMTTWYPPGKSPRDLPMRIYPSANRQDIRLVGHEHNNAPIFIKWVRDKGDKPRPIMALNMSCEHWGYKPVLLETVISTYQEFMGKHGLGK